MGFKSGKTLDLEWTSVLESLKDKNAKETIFPKTGSNDLMTLAVKSNVELLRLGYF